jgi:hypothetical protein
MILREPLVIKGSLDGDYPEESIVGREKMGSNPNERNA